jgi:hypothetical protein
MRSDAYREPVRWWRGWHIAQTMPKSTSMEAGDGEEKGEESSQEESQEEVDARITGAERSPPPPVFPL